MGLKSHFDDYLSKSDVTAHFWFGLPFDRMLFPFPVNYKVATTSVFFQFQNLDRIFKIRLINVGIRQKRCQIGLLTFSFD